MHFLQVDLDCYLVVLISMIDGYACNFKPTIKSKFHANGFCFVYLVFMNKHVDIDLKVNDNDLSMVQSEPPTVFEF